MAYSDASPIVDFYVVTGEISGDQRAGELIESLYKRLPRVRIAGVAGPAMRALNVQSTIPMESLQVMGFIDVFFALPRIRKLFYAITAEILTLNPAIVILVDYPGLNLRIAKYLRKKGYAGKIVQYVCPSVWAWGKKRIPLMEKNLDLLLTLFPFEPAFFQKLPAQYIGHPLTAKVVQPLPPRNRPLLGIFPGSREKEILHNLPLQLHVAEESGLPLVISCAQKSLLPLITRINQGRHRIAPPEETETLLTTCTYAIATSGTICLELALHNIPTVCTYFIRKTEELLAKYIFKIKLPFYCITNIVAGKEIFPELFGSNMSESALQDALSNLIEARHFCDTELVRKRLGNLVAPEEAAEKIIPLLPFEKPSNDKQ